MPSSIEAADMTERERALAEYIAQHTIARAFDAAKDPERAQQVVGVWADSFYRVIGKTVVRLALYIIGVALLVSAAKTGMIDSWLSKLK